MAVHQVSQVVSKGSQKRHSIVLGAWNQDLGPTTTSKMDEAEPNGGPRGGSLASRENHNKTQGDLKIGSWRA